MCGVGYLRGSAAAWKRCSCGPSTASTGGPCIPLGFVIGVGWLTGQIWFSVLVAWLLKLVILRYGGIQLFNGLKPFFLGMILGECATSGLWLLIDVATDTVGNHLTAT